MFVVGIGTMALIIVLSVFNGLEGLLKNLYGGFDADVVISASAGKSFTYNEELREKIEQVEGTAFIAEVIEDNVLIKYNQSQRVVRMKGVSNEYLSQGRIDRSIVAGDPKLTEGNMNYAIVGRGVQYDLSINPNNDFFTVQFYYPRDIGPGVTNPEKMYNIRYAYPASVFAIEKYYDENYVFIPIKLAEELTSYKNRRTSIEIELKENTDPIKVKNELQSLLGNDFKVLQGEEQHEDLYKILRIEKLFVFIIFALVIAIASINIYFALTMLVIEKKKDIAILFAQGGTSGLIKRIFLKEGAIIAFSGSLVGLALGLGISYAQEQYGLISMGLQTSIMNAYPVKIIWPDVIFSILTIILITFLASIQPAIKASKHPVLEEL